MFVTLSNILKRIRSGELLINLYSKGSFRDYPTNEAWIPTVIGSGSAAQRPQFLFVDPGTSANGSALLFAGTFNLSDTGSKFKINWDKKIHFSFECVRTNSDSQSVGRTQLKESNTEGILSASGIGIRIDNYTMYGESFGVSLQSTNIFTLTDDIPAKINIIHTPGKSVEFWVNNQLKTIHKNVNNIPSGLSTGNGFVVHSVNNGETGGVNAYYYLSQPRIWQDN